MSTSGLPKLKGTRIDAEQRIDRQIKDGRRLRNIEIEIGSSEALKEAGYKFQKWNDYNKDLVEMLFETPPHVSLYSFSSSDKFTDYEDYEDLEDGVETYREEIGKRIATLISIKRRLLEIWEPAQISTPMKSPSNLAMQIGKKVFVVHGKDEAIREKVARFLERLGFEPIILHEQVNKGKTIIEKLENNAAAYAVVLMTPDDVGGTSKEDLRPRARQNVVFEWGYLIGCLGRDKVCLLYDERVELPSDMDGIVYEPLDKRDGWRLRLAKEMKSAKLDVDLNKVI